MQSRPFSYRFQISYLGSRFKGWAPQPNQPTVQRKLERVLRHVLGHEDFSLIGGSRTDAGVSCRQGFFQLFLREAPQLDELMMGLDRHLPDDILVENPVALDPAFNLIQSVASKTYRYYFSNHPDFKPAYSSQVTRYRGALELAQMKEVSQLFVGEHDFYAFCRPSATKKNYRREILAVNLATTDDLDGIRLPFPFFYMEVTGKGFLHHQLRKMMTSIWEVGSGSWQLKDIKDRLQDPQSDWEQIPPAPAHGLILWTTELKPEGSN
ncbi:tRNA pseudouridine(38-40) synthase TruA [Algoriphagus namhaensis]